MAGPCVENLAASGMRLAFRNGVHASTNDWERERRSLLDQRISELGLTVRGSLVEKYVDRLYAELDAKGLRFHPPVYLSDEWGCPEGTPLIGSSLLPRRSTARTNRRGARGRSRVRGGRDALPAARSGSRTQLCVPIVRPRRLAPNLRIVLPPVSRPVSRESRFRVSTCATSSDGTRRSIPTRTSPRRSRCG